MNRCLAFMHRALLCGVLALPFTASAAPVNFALALNGPGILQFDSTAGTGIWTGCLDEAGCTPLPSAMALLSVVTFNFDDTTNMLQGMFEFTSNADFASTLLGRVDGLLTGSFGAGGQLDLDYSIQDGTGQFASAEGFGSSLLAFGPVVGGFGEYRESISLVFSVPEPAGLGLASAALLGLLITRRKAAPLN